MATNFCHAAQRTFRDAAILEKADRLASADHLFGLAAECALKAILAGLGVIPRQGKPPKPYDVHMPKIWEQFSAYVSGRSDYSLPDENPFEVWQIDHRYEADETFTVARVQKHKAGARRVAELLDRALLRGQVP
jgi:hypothetical protein